MARLIFRSVELGLGALLAAARALGSALAYAVGLAVSFLPPLNVRGRRLAGIGFAAVAGIGVAGLWTQNQFLSPEAGARAALARARAAEAPETAALTHALVTREQETLEVARGESLALVLARANIPWADITPSVEAVSAVFDPRHMREGQQVKIFYEPSGDDEQLTGLAFRADPGSSIVVNRSIDGAFHAREIQTPWKLEMMHVDAKISGSLYQSAIEAGATEKEVAAISNVFSYDIDFQRDVFPGDTFELLFERYTDDDGRTIRTGDLNYVALTTRRGPRAYYFFRAPGETDGAWYDASGHSARKFLMKTPIDGARLTSSFGMRMHPILGYSRMHKGVDFAARTGTPIRAAGDGVIVRSSWFGSYGNYVRIHHSDDYDTAYAHMSAFAQGIHPGVHVSQGTVIGYVGATGSATGPHLHYEVLRYNSQINPMNLNFATGRNLDGKTLEAFKTERDRIDALRAGEAPLVAAASVGAAELRGGLE